MLASSIDFEVEFQLVAFVQLTHARAFDRADVNERIGLSIVTRDKAEAFHGVEELDRALGFFAGELPLRRGRLGSYRHNVANNLQVGRGNLSAAIDQVELQLLTFGQAFEASALDCADVHEHIFAAVFTLNEAKTLLGVEELHDALAGADNLGRHSAATAACATAWAAEATTAAAAAARTAEAATAACAITAAKAAAAGTIATAEATAITTAEATTTAAAEAAAITTAEATTAAAAATEAAAIIAAAATAATAEAAVGVEIAIFAETVALVASATPPSVKTHKNQ